MLEESASSSIPPKKSKSATEDDNTAYSKVAQLWQAVKDASLGRYWLSFASYLFYWMSTYDADASKIKYNALADRMITHELRLPLQQPSSKLIDVTEGQCDIRRIFWIQDGDILSFGLMCDEFASQKVSYVQFLENSEYGEKCLRPVLRAYAEFLALISPGWVLHIWADAPAEGESYLFRQAPHPKSVTTETADRSQALKNSYTALLQQSGFDVKPYTWEPHLPLLPSIGKKAEPDVRARFASLKQKVMTEVQELNAMFGNTLCTELKLRHSVPPLPCYTGWNTFIRADKPLFTNTHFSENLNLSFQTRQSAVPSTVEIIRMMSSYGSTYYRQTLVHLDDMRGVRDFYEAVLRLVREVQRCTVVRAPSACVPPVGSISSNPSPTMTLPVKSCEVLAQYLAQHRLQRVPTPGAGDCYFYCLSHFRFGVWDRALELRHDLMNWLSERVFGTSLAALATTQESSLQFTAASGSYLQSVLKADSANLMSDPVVVKRCIQDNATPGYFAEMEAMSDLASRCWLMEITVYHLSGSTAQRRTFPSPVPTTNPQVQIAYHQSHFEVLHPL